MAANDSTTSQRPAELDASKLVVTTLAKRKPLPPMESLVFGETKTDHMLIINYTPATGWSAPVIKPYGPLSLDPMSSCLQYSQNVFEGMKVYLGTNGEARLFRPNDNMARLARSAARLALPAFNPDELLALIKELIKLELRWIPKAPGCSLYIRPTIIGTRAALGAVPSDSACIFVIVTPAGPYFQGSKKGISLLAIGENIRLRPGGSGGHKLGLNYASGFLPQTLASKQGYDQVLWLLGKSEKVTEAGAMNLFFAVQRRDGDVDLITPPLDGTILPGITRACMLAFAEAHSTGKIVLPGVPASLKLHVHERPVTMGEIDVFSTQIGRILEVFGVGTAVIVVPITRIGWRGKDIVLPVHEGNGLGQIGHGMWQMMVDVQTGKTQFEDWSVVCD